MKKTYTIIDFPNDGEKYVWNEENQSWDLNETIPE